MKWKRKQILLSCFLVSIKLIVSSVLLWICFYLFVYYTPQQNIHRQGFWVLLPITLRFYSRIFISVSLVMFRRIQTRCVQYSDLSFRFAFIGRHNMNEFCKLRLNQDLRFIVTDRLDRYEHCDKKKTLDGISWSLWVWKINLLFYFFYFHISDQTWKKN